MTIAELERALASAVRVEKRRAQEKAYFDYQLADTIGRSMARLYSKNAQLPDIAEIYPQLFDSKEIEEHKSIRKGELSAARFKQFAQTYNTKYKEVAKTE